jgi:hypothetical protein
MSWLDWFMIACGICGAVFLAIGIRCACAGRRDRAERATLKRAAAEWSRRSQDEAPAPAGRAR